MNIFLLEVALVISLTATIYLALTTLSAEKAVNRLSKAISQSTANARIEQTVRTLMQRSRRSRTFLQRFELLVDKSQITRWLPGFNIVGYLILAGALFAGSLAFSVTYLNNLLAGIIIAVVLVGVPLEVMTMLVQANSLRIVGQMPIFLQTVSYYYTTSGDVIKAMERTADRISNPLESHIRRMVYEQKHGLKVEECLERLRDRVDNREFGTFIDNVQLNYSLGGNLGEIMEMIMAQAQDRLSDGKKRLAEVYSILVVMGVILSILVTSLIGVDQMMPEVTRFLRREPIGHVVVDGAIMIVTLSLWIGYRAAFAK